MPYLVYNRSTSSLDLGNPSGTRVRVHPGQSASTDSLSETMIYLHLQGSVEVSPFDRANLSTVRNLTQDQLISASGEILRPFATRTYYGLNHITQWLHLVSTGKVSSTPDLTQVPAEPTSDPVAPSLLHTSVAPPPVNPAEHQVVVADSSSGGFSVPLTTPSLSSPNKITVKNSGTNTVTVSSSDGKLIDTFLTFPVTAYSSYDFLFSPQEDRWLLV